MEIFSSILKNDIEACILECLRGADVNALCNEDGRPPLHVACALGFPDIIRALLQFGAHVSHKDEYGINALKYTIATNQNNMIAILDLLLSTTQLHDTDTCDENFTIFDYCIRYDTIDAFNLLLDYGYVPDYVSLYKMASLYDNQIFVLHILQLQGTSVGQIHKDTILYWSAIGGSLRLVKTALSLGANIDNENHNALGAAIRHAHPHIVQALLKENPSLTTWMFSTLTHLIGLSTRLCDLDLTPDIKQTEEKKLARYHTIMVLLKGYNKAYVLVKGVQECPICYKTTIGYVAKTPCNHTFCVSCINKIRGAETIPCPMCRQALCVKTM